MATIGYCTTFKLGDKVKPIASDDDTPLMTVCTIQLSATKNVINEYYEVAWFADGVFKEQWVKDHQIKKVG